MASRGGHLAGLARVAAFSLGALLVSVSVYGLAAELLLPIPRTVMLAITLLLFAWSMRWHTIRAVSVPFGLSSIQANKASAASGVPGALYFGAILGSGLTTRMATPLVQAGFALAVLAGPGRALVYGFMFAVGRSTPPWLGLARGGITNPHRVTLTFVNLMSRLRWIGVMVAAGGAAVAAAVV